jgi:hypothetical protein
MECKMSKEKRVEQEVMNRRYHEKEKHDPKNTFSYVDRYPLTACDSRSFANRPGHTGKGNRDSCPTAIDR